MMQAIMIRELKEMNNKKNQYCYRYPHPAVTTDCVIFGIKDRRLFVLLIKRGREPYKNKWAFPGGFLNENETAEQGAARELKEETGIEVNFLDQFYTFTDPQRDSRERVISIGFISLTRVIKVKGGDDAAKARWFLIDAIPPLAFDHDKMLQLGLKRLQRKLKEIKRGRTE